MMPKRRKPAFITLPLSIFYGFITGIRNLLFDFNILKQKHFHVPVLSVGNITVGGTGKTPHIEYLVKQFGNRYKLAVLSRGYKRKTKGFMVAGAGSRADDIGDEPKQVKVKFPDTVVAVSKKRVEGLNKLLAGFPDLQIILLDDAFQHRYVLPDLSVLLIDYNRQMYNDRMLPYGNLREYRNGMKRADIIIITKTPETITPEEQASVVENLGPLPQQTIFFTSMRYGKISPVFSENTPVAGNNPLGSADTGILLLTGIASPEPLFDYLRSKNSNIVPVFFPDHHFFSVQDFVKISGMYKNFQAKNKLIITTEKDAVRISELSFLDNSIKKNMYYIPVEVHFLNNDELRFKRCIDVLFDKYRK